MTYSFGVFLGPLGSTFDASTARTSLVFGVQLFVLYAAAAPMGGLVEWLGPSRGLVVAAAFLSSVPADLFGSRTLDTLFGLVSLSFVVPRLFGLAAARFDRLGTYTSVFVASGVVGLTGVALVAGAARLQGELGGRP